MDGGHGSEFLTGLMIATESLVCSSQAGVLVGERAGKISNGTAFSSCDKGALGKCALKNEGSIYGP